MRRIILLLMLVFAASSTNALTAKDFVVHHDLTKAPLPGFIKWSSVALLADHRDRQPAQPPQEWTNLTFPIPCNPFSVDFTAVQLTSCNSSKCNGTDVSERVVTWSIDELANALQVSIVWWGMPWKLLIGWEPPV